MAPHKKKRRLVTEYPVIYTKLASSNGCSSPNMANICKHHDSLVCMCIYIYMYIIIHNHNYPKDYVYDLWYNYIYITPKEDRKGSIYPKNSSHFFACPRHPPRNGQWKKKCSFPTKKKTRKWVYHGHIMAISWLYIHIHIYIIYIQYMDFLMTISWLYNDFFMGCDWDTKWRLPMGYSYIDIMLRILCNGYI